MIAMQAFGSFDLHDDGKSLHTVLSQPKRAALLAYLVLARPGKLQRRDALLALFWPDLDHARARNALSQSLTFLRRRLPDGLLVTRGSDEVGVDSAGLRCDAVEFEAAVAGGRWTEALELYRGPLLEGLHVAGAPDFMSWLDLERERLREMASGAAWWGAHANIAAGALTEAERLAQRALRLVPTDESPVRDFIEALAGAGDRAAALRFYEKFVTVLADELEVEPAPETVAVAEAVRARSEPVEPVARVLSVDGRVSATGEGDSGCITTGMRLHRWLRRSVNILVAGASLVVVAVAAGLALHAVRGAGPSRASSARTVAVTPVQDLSGDPGQAYLSEGMTEALIVSLYGIPGLEVISAGPGGTVGSEPNQRLGADTVIATTLLRVGDRIRVVTELKCRSTGRVLWSARYDRDLSDVLALQAEIARAIAERVDVALTPRDEQRLAKAVPQAPTSALIEAMLRVHYLIWRSTPEDLRQATMLLEQALDVAPGYAPAWSALAMAYLTQSGWFSGASADSTMPRAQRALRRALALDPNDVDVQAVRAELALHEWRWKDAEQGYRKVLARDPTHWLVAVSLPNLLTFMGRFDEAESIERRIIALKPLSPSVHAELLNTLASEGNMDEARKVLVETAEMDPSLPSIRELGTLGLAQFGFCQDSGDLFPADLGIGGALAEADHLVGQVCADVPFCLYLAAFAYLQCGRRDRAEDLYDRVEAMARTRYTSPVVRAQFHLMMGGDRDGALDLLEEGLRTRDVDMIRVPSGFTELHGDPRFEAIAKQVGLPRLRPARKQDADTSAHDQANVP